MRIFFAILFGFFAASAAAQVEHTPAHCIAMVDHSPFIQKASVTQLQKDDVRISYIDHSMFRIETFGGLSAITDFNGFIGRDPVYPDIVTMNRAHDSHYTNDIPDSVSHILRGWRIQGEPAFHNLDLGELRVRNVTTDIRSEYTGRDPDGNSIFIFEVGGLCIGHLGHLHHEPNDAQYAMIGRLDVVMANVDGGLSLDTATMVKIMKRVRASVVLPMHYWGRGSLEIFLSGMRDEFDVVDVEAGSIIVSQNTLPSRPTVFVLPAMLYSQPWITDN
ncbi:MAG: MBL fold metallo-hydrolase [Pseudomonadota bacterium]